MPAASATRLETATKIIRSPANRHHAIRRDERVYDRLLALGPNSDPDGFMAFLVRHPMADRVINRNYACIRCGKLRRAPAAYLPDTSESPKCCEVAMTMLSYEQTEAATQLSDQQRVEWLASGGEVARRGGKRGWTARW
jgi:hypothetical protein